MKRLVACAAGSLITQEDLSDDFTPPASRAAELEASDSGGELKTATERLERQMIAQALERAGNNHQSAARALGLSRQGLLNKMKRYGIGM